MRMNFFTYQPQFKLTIIGNHKPALKNVDDAAKRRFNLVPFNHKPAVVDRELEKKLESEWPAILRWMIDGCLDWQASGGLARPESMMGATAEYFETQDVFGQWLADECDLEPENPHKRGTSAELFTSWTQYAARAGEEAGSGKRFAENLRGRGVTPIKRVAGRDSSRGFTGIRLKPPRQEYGADK